MRQEFMIIKLFGQGTQSDPTSFDKPALFPTKNETADNSDKRVVIKVVTSNSIQVATPYQTSRKDGYETHEFYSLG